MSDSTKLIFIIIDLNNQSNTIPVIEEILNKHGLKGSMAGDINLFLNRDSEFPKRGELSIMIAEKES